MARRGAEGEVATPQSASSAGRSARARLMKTTGCFTAMDAGSRWREEWAWRRGMQERSGRGGQGTIMWTLWTITGGRVEALLGQTKKQEGVKSKCSKMKRGMRMRYRR